MEYLPNAFQIRMDAGFQGRDFVGKFWVVTLPRTRDAQGLEDHCFETDVPGLFRQMRGGLRMDEIFGFYTDQDQARAVARQLLQGIKNACQCETMLKEEIPEDDDLRFAEFTRELAELSTKYRFAVQSTGGVYHVTPGSLVEYDADLSSGDLRPSFEDR
jgi:hypothetical protein